MPYIKLVEKGFEGFNGSLSRVKFENGVSTEPLSMRDAEKLGNVMKIVDRDTGKQISHSQRLLDSLNNTPEPVSSFVPIDRTRSTLATEKPNKEKHSPKSTLTPELLNKEYKFTEDMLATIADKRGIAGIREFAKEYEVNGKSVREIIGTLLAMKKAAEKAAEKVAKNDESSQ